MVGGRAKVTLLLSLPLRVTLRESRDLGASTGYLATSQRWWYLPYALVGLS